MDWQLTVLSGIRAASALCAGVLGLVAYRAYIRTRSSALLRLSVASGLLLTGLLGAGVLYQSTGELAWASVFEAPFTLAALLTILVSLYGREARADPTRPDAVAR